jgi:hypothetical protein
MCRRLRSGARLGAAIEHPRNGGKLEIAQQVANHESARTTGLYDQRDYQLSLEFVIRILVKNLQTSACRL